MRLAVAIAVLIVLTAPALALEKLTSDHFTFEFKIDPEKDCYTMGERINAEMGIYPKKSDYRSLLGGDKDNPRTYYFQTDLSDAVWRLKVEYAGGGTWDEEMRGSKASIEAKYFEIDEDRKGISKIVANLTGIVPYCKARLCEFFVINPTCELCEADALQNKTIKVANEEGFKNDIKSLRAKLSELAEKLKVEGLYNEEDFKNVTELINSAEDFVFAKKFLDADRKLKDAEEAMSILSNLTNKKVVEKLYSETNSKLSELKETLLNSSVMLEKIKESDKYVDLALKQKDYESKLGELEAQLREAKSLIDSAKYGNAKEKLETISKEAEELIKGVEDLRSIIIAEAEKSRGGIFAFSLPSIDPILALSGIAVIATAIVAGVGLNKYRKRRKWDELR